MSVRIIVDSTADLTEETKKRLTAVPLTIYFGEEEYVDGVTITHKEFYKKLVESDVLPTTSQPTPAAFAAAFEEATSTGDSVVVLTISSKLSGTYQSACIAAEDFDNVYVVDTLSAAIGAGILAELALQLADQGMSAQDIAETITRERENICLFGVLDTLEYLKKGGRISSTVAFVGGILSIKPVITVSEGAVAMVGKARGNKQGNNMLVSEIQKAGGIDFSKPMMLGYTGQSDELLRSFITQSSELWNAPAEELPKSMICSVIGTHVGPGAVAAAFFKKN